VSQTAVNEGAEVFGVACGDSWIGAPVEGVEYEAQQKGHSVSVPDNLEHQVSHVSSLKLQEGNSWQYQSVCSIHTIPLTACLRVVSSYNTHPRAQMSLQKVIYPIIPSSYTHRKLLTSCYCKACSHRSLERGSMEYQYMSLPAPQCCREWSKAYNAL